MERGWKGWGVKRNIHVSFQSRRPENVDGDTCFSSYVCAFVCKSINSTRVVLGCWLSTRHAWLVLGCSESGRSTLCVQARKLNLLVFIWDIVQDAACRLTCAWSSGLRETFSGIRNISRVLSWSQECDTNPAGNMHQTGSRKHYVDFDWSLFDFPICSDLLLYLVLSSEVSWCKKHKSHLCHTYIAG